MSAGLHRYAVHLQETRTNQEVDNVIVEAATAEDALTIVRVNHVECGHRYEGNRKVRLYAITGITPLPPEASP